MCSCAAARCLLFVVAIGVYSNVSRASQDAPIVRTVYGDVRGSGTGKTRQFLGIPFATPPTKEMRWVSPVMPVAWGPDILNVTDYKPACPQKYCSTFLPNNSCPVQMSEDCLYLNVWTPLNATKTSNLPVMVFIHGGAFKWGSASDKLYDGSNLSQMGDVVVVTIEYRLGMLGFLYTGDTPVDAEGNYGIQDQRMALQWVQQNINNFGGNHFKVTIFGQSAGAQSVFAHVTSPKSDGLFQAAVVESSPFGIRYRTRPEALELSRKVREILKCSSKDMYMFCLRSKSTEDINDAQKEAGIRITGSKLYEYFEPFGPIIDENDITLQPLDAAKRGSFRDIPVILGSVSEEGRLFVYGTWKANLTKTEYEAAIVGLRPDDYKNVLQHYGTNHTITDYRDLLSQVVSDYLFVCPTRNVSQNLVRRHANQTFLYLFDHATIARGGWGKDSFCEGHVCHAEELAYVFQNVKTGNKTSQETRLSDLMINFWSNFAHTLNPNMGSKPLSLTWHPQISDPPWNLIYFKTPTSEAVLQYRSYDCDFWDNIGYV